MRLEEKHVAVGCFRAITYGHVRVDRHLYLELDLLTLDVKTDLQLDRRTDLKTDHVADWDWLGHTVFLRLIVYFSQTHAMNCLCLDL